jgi:hypothetical protein
MNFVRVFKCNGTKKLQVLFENAAVECGIRCVEGKVKAGVWRVKKQIRVKTGLNKQHLYM